MCGTRLYYARYAILNYNTKLLFAHNKTHKLIELFNACPQNSHEANLKDHKERPIQFY